MLMVWNLIRSWSSGTSQKCRIRCVRWHSFAGHCVSATFKVASTGHLVYVHRGLIVDKDLGNLCKVDRFGCAPAELPAAR